MNTEEGVSAIIRIGFSIFSKWYRIYVTRLVKTLILAL